MVIECAFLISTCTECQIRFPVQESSCGVLPVFVFLCLVPPLPGVHHGKAAVLLGQRAGVEAEAGQLQLVQRVQLLSGD